MQMDSMAFFRVASDRMEWLTTRQKVVAENVANADTPGYAARDVSSFQQMLEGQRGQGTTLARTDPMHRPGSTGAGPVRVIEDQAPAHSPDGNSISLEEQTVKAAEISSEYRMAATLYRKGYELLTLSVTGRS
ncbi:flagellar basal body rod protein FlgB [Mesobaculum littorinae]|uniref:Flagellar basal body rod protein FlgB n=1 Tax=Mesobaculum littorinae TaxID=2486419 RepID=A0A438ADV9_9RHOB|nr:flagellar basal body rod protein FlgB [Mesobaculum littorinae]RVV96890.1 flagellar basal body rod protein FlgB [Mesobaculum littorinae]